MPTHPLHLPEILSHIAVHVPEASLSSCARVAKAWYHAFVPHIWKDISTDSSIPNHTMSSHSHLVKALHIQFTLPEGLVTWRFPCLTALDIFYSGRARGLTEFISSHSTLTHLALRLFSIEPRSMFWQRLLALHHLNSLMVLGLDITEEQEVDSFWQLCTRLERLDIGIHRLSSTGTLSSIKFPRIKRIYLNTLHDNTLPYMELIQRCPSLITICLDGSLGKELISQFSQLVLARTWSGLEDVSLLSDSNYRIARDELSNILQSLHRVIALNLPNVEAAFGPRPMELIRPHFSYLRKLDFRNDCCLKSPMAQEILSSCPLLEEFGAFRMDATDIAGGKPWVCMKMVSLSVSFRFGYGPTNVKLQPIVFDQLSRLTRLETLRLDDNPEGTFDSWLDDMDGKQSLDLHLRRGLGKLSTLRSLSCLSLKNAHQSMGQQEVEWMVEHWTRLSQVHGTLHYRRDIDMELRRLLNKYVFPGVISVTSEENGWRAQNF